MNEIEIVRMEEVVCPYCGSKGPFLESNRGFSLWPELGKTVRLCKNCQGPFGVGSSYAHP